VGADAGGGCGAPAVARSEEGVQRDGEEATVALTGRVRQRAVGAEKDLAPGSHQHAGLRELLREDSCRAMGLNSACDLLAKHLVTMCTILVEWISKGLETMVSGTYIYFYPGWSQETLDPYLRAEELRHRRGALRRPDLNWT